MDDNRKIQDCKCGFGLAVYNLSRELALQVMEKIKWTWDKKGNPLCPKCSEKVKVLDTWKPCCFAWRFGYCPVHQES